MGNTFSCNTPPVRDGYKLYYSDVKLLFPVGMYPSGYRFMEAIVDDNNRTIDFINYGSFDTEYKTTIKLNYELNHPSFDPDNIPLI